MALGNSLNPPGRSAVPRPMASDGYDTVRHSPSGQLYGLPYDNSAETTRTEGGWEYSGGVDVGILGGDAGKKNALFRKYKDLKDGPYLDYFEVESEKVDTANFIQAFGGGTGRHDQFYGMQFGRYNDWKAKFFYNEIIHVYTDTWKSLHNGEGTGDLTTGLAQPRPDAPAVTDTIANRAAALGLVAVGAGNCTATAPCWAYKGNLYSNATAVAAINGVAGTYNAAGVLIPGTPQSGMAKAISDKLAVAPNTELSVVRKKGGVRVDATLDNFWKGYASYSQEERKGARPFAMNEGNISAEIAEPINYTTHEMLTGLQFVDSLTQANLRASLSLFRNNIKVLNVQDTLLSENTVSGAAQTGTFALNPDNSAFNLKGEFARQLPDFYKGRFTAAMSWGTNRQNDALLAPISAAQNAQFAAAGITTLAGNSIGYAAGSGLVSNWNTTAALSQQTAKQRIDNKLIDLGLSFRPIDDLGVKGSFRSYETVNKGGYMAYNPLTGQFGRGLADGNNLTGLDTIVGLKPGAVPGTPGSCYVPPGYPTNALIATCQFGLAGVVANGANVPVFGQARSTKQTNYVLAADYDLTRTSAINTVLEREEFKRNFRERDKTWEDKLKLGYVDRALESATLRASVETDRKRGGEYRFRTFEDLGTALPGLTPQEQLAAAGVLAGYANPVNVNLFNRYSFYFRKYDQADRNQNIGNLRVNYLLREDLDLGVSVQMKNATYPNSIYGLTKDNQTSGTLEFNYQPSSGETFYGFYSRQEGKQEMKMNSGTAGAAIACTSANIALYGYAACSDTITGLNGSRPYTSAWSSTTNDINDVFGFGLQRDIGSMKFGLDYTYSSSATKIGYQFGSTALANPNGALAAIAGSALPNMTYVQQTLNFNLLIPIDKKMSIRLFDRFEIGKVKDWHYDGVITGAVANYDSGTLLLDAGPQSYRANVIGVFIQYKL